MCQHKAYILPLWGHFTHSRREGWAQRETESTCHRGPNNTHTHTPCLALPAPSMITSLTVLRVSVPPCSRMHGAGTIFSFGRPDALSTALQKGLMHTHTTASHGYGCEWWCACVCVCVCEALLLLLLGVVCLCGSFVRLTWLRRRERRSPCAARRMHQQRRPRPHPQLV